MHDRLSLRSSFTWMLFGLFASCAQSSPEGVEVPALGSTLCRSEPERLVRLPGRWTALAVGEDAIYLGKDAIWRLPKRAGAELVRFADSPATVRKLVVHGEHVFWLSAGPLRAPAALFTAAESDRKPHAVHHATGNAFGSSGRAALATSETFVVVTFEVEPGRYQVARVKPGGNTADAYVQIDGAGPFELAADDDRVYVSGNGSVATWDEDGQRHTTPSAGTKLIEDQDFLYWIEDGMLPNPQLVRAPKDTLAREDFAEVSSGDHLQLATDDTSPDIYWTDESGSITRVPKVDGSSSIVTTTGEYDDDDFDTLLAVDRSSVYWIGGTPGTRVSDDGSLWLYRMCKTGGAR